MQNHGHLQLVGCKHHGHGHIAAFGKDQIRLLPPDDFLCLKISPQYFERIDKILKAEIAAQLSRIDGIVRQVRLLLDNLPLDALF